MRPCLDIARHMLIRVLSSGAGSHWHTLTLHLFERTGSLTRAASR